MQTYTDSILYKTHQHFIVVISKFLRIFLPYAFIVIIAGKYVFEWTILLQLVVLITWAFCIGAWYYYFWVKSYFIISNEKIIVKVRNGLFSKFHMSIHYKNIRDMAFSKNNILHYALGYGTFFARSSAGAVWDLEAKQIPNIEKVYKIVNYLYNLSEEERRNVDKLDEKLQPFSLEKREDSGESFEKAIEKEKNILLGIQWLKEVVVLTDADRRNIFETEEEKNHWVHECLRRQVLFAATHDSTFRDPDEAIVMKAGEKVIFPVVEFHEIKRKKVSSSSPWMDVHNYLVSKFQDFGPNDATLLIWFDI